MSDEQRWYTEPGGHWTRVKFVGQQPLGVICETTKEWAEQIVRDHNAALEAADRQATLAAELGRVKAALMPMEAWMSHAISVMKDRRLVSLDQIEDGDAILELARAALDTAPAVAPGVSDAGETTWRHTCDACGDPITEDYVETLVEGDTGEYHVACTPSSVPMRTVLMAPGAEDAGEGNGNQRTG
jgi:hypothetical protein